MIESEFEYKQHLRNVRGLVEGTCNSYLTYLAAITNHLKIDINSESICDSTSVTSILEKLKSTGIDRNYWGNCRSALRAYLKFLEHEKSCFTTLPEEEIAFVEGNCVEIKVNKYERDPRARAECIKYHGAKCKVCDLDFSKMYGEIGQGFIHVHHLTPISNVGTGYKINPVKDLVPICPNCHSMLHTKRPPYTIAQLKNKITV